ncbi:hypothetical protein [Zooshikella ganghwensis]|uniref:Uncharacterized protein n=1 Tax=Zooshikella ganghwensis TaxID=202772 RepID=A0A4P9VN51_9GAMM|nr:hypothetical protein [Zooshikella ganghwensis]RDH43837.1 hypothetical protein B9G39_10485 [Zooshikella ganghwensis]
MNLKAAHLVSALFCLIPLHSHSDIIDSTNQSISQSPFIKNAYTVIEQNEKYVISFPIISDLGSQKISLTIGNNELKRSIISGKTPLLKINFALPKETFNTIENNSQMTINYGHTKYNVGEFNKNKTKKINTKSN